jgi:hypothetical protein
VVTVTGVLGVAFVILVPLVLLALLFVYLRRTAPGGVVAPAVVPEALTAATDGPAGRVKGAVQCKNCGMSVTPARPGTSIPRCPNCNTALPVA